MPTGAQKCNGRILSPARPTARVFSGLFPENETEIINIQFTQKTSSLQQAGRGSRRAEEARS